jgi:PAS domain S-box-containing protein
MSDSIQILCMSRSEADAAVWQKLLSESGLRAEFTVVSTAEEAAALVESKRCDLILAAVADSVDGENHLTAHVDKLVETRPVILIGAPVHQDLIVEALKSGASDYVTTDHMNRLYPSVERALREVQVKQTAAQAALSLRASEERFRCLSASSPMGIFLTDIRGHVIYTNQRFRSILGLTFMETLGERWTRSVLQQDRVQVLREWFSAVSQGRELSVEFRVKTPQGLVRWVHVRSSPMLSDDDKLQGHVGTIEDIHERKQAEVSLRDSEERYRSLVQNARDVIFMLGMDGMIKSLNPAFELITGWRTSEWLGHTFGELCHADDLTLAVSMFWRVLQGERVAPFELRILAKGDRNLIAEFTVTGHFERGKMVGVLGIARDITDRKMLEDQLAQSQKMEAVGQLAGGVAHDFNNILTAITGYSDMLVRKLRTDDPLYQNAEEIRKASERASALTRQLLAFSRKQVLKAEVVDLDAVVTDISKMLQRVIGEHIQLVTRSKASRAHVKADRGQIEQVILNMAVNARDAMTAGGTLIIETDVVTPDGDFFRTHKNLVPGNYVLMRISDTGTGMPPEVKARIFEPFFTTKEKGKGTGLGLATCYGIVTQTGGQLTVDSAPGKGTTFSIYLPLSMEETVQDKLVVKDDPDMPRGRETLLLVEDEMIVRELALLVLSDLGYEVLTAVNGEEALRVAENHAGTLQLVITDVVMPLMGGKELSGHMRKRYPRVKVIFSSGYTDDAISDQGALGEGVAFLQKPYTPIQLARKVRSVLDARNLQPSEVSPTAPGKGGREDAESDGVLESVCVKSTG